MGFWFVTYAQVVTIGSQVWMTKNLDVIVFRNGDTIPQVKSDDEWKEAWLNSQPAWCYYENDSANGKIYGKLYNWFAVNDSRGLAPNGYYVPSETDWMLLINYLGGYKAAGTKMKSSSGWTVSDDGENLNGSNTSGFLALPGGERSSFGWFSMDGYQGYWWSSTKKKNEYGEVAGRMSIQYDGFVHKELHSPGDGYSVRCLRYLNKKK